MTTQVQNTTAEELLHLPDDGLRYELIRGELKKMALAGNEHGALALEFAAELRNFVKANKLGRVYAAETGFKLAPDPDTVCAPDAAFISRKRLDEVGPVEGYWPGAPDLAAEVISPSDLYTEVSEKVAEWLAAGAKMVVVVNPHTRQLLVHLSLTEVKVLGVGDTLEGGEVVPGCSYRLGSRSGVRASTRSGPARFTFPNFQSNYGRTALSSPAQSGLAS